MRALYPNRPVRGDDFPHSTGHSDDCIQAFWCFKKQDEHGHARGSRVALTVPNDLSIAWIYEYTAWWCMMEFNAVYKYHTNMGSAKTHDGFNTSFSYASFKGLKVYLFQAHFRSKHFQTTFWCSWCHNGGTWHLAHLAYLPTAKHLHLDFMNGHIHYTIVSITGSKVLKS